MKKYLLLYLAIILLAFSAVSAQEPPASYKAKVKELMTLNGTEKVFKQTIQQMINQFKKSEKKVPPAFWTDFEKEFMDTSIDDLVDKFSPIYYKYLTGEDLDKLIEFLNSPAGKKFAKSTPAISQESYKIGQEWGKSVANRIIEKFQSLISRDSTKKE